MPFFRKGFFGGSSFGTRGLCLEMIPSELFDLIGSDGFVLLPSCFGSFELSLLKTSLFGKEIGGFDPSFELL